MGHGDYPLLKLLVLTQHRAVHKEDINPRPGTTFIVVRRTVLKDGKSLEKPLGHCGWGLGPSPTFGGNICGLSGDY